MRIVNHSRPKNLNLFTIHFPIPAIVSILHRVTGAFLFLMIPVVMYAWQLSLTYNGFDRLRFWMHAIHFKLLIWLLFIPFIFHLVAGVRHLLSDIHFGDSLKLGRLMAQLTFVVTALLVIIVGIWLW